MVRNMCEKGEEKEEETEEEAVLEREKKKRNRRRRRRRRRRRKEYTLQEPTVNIQEFLRVMSLKKTSGFT